VTNLTGEQKITSAVRERRHSGQATVTVEAQAPLCLGTSSARAVQASASANCRRQGVCSWRWAGSSRWRQECREFRNLVTEITALVAMQAPYGGAITQSVPDGAAYEIRIGEREESPRTEFLRVVLRANRRRLCARTHHASLLLQLRVPPRSLQGCLLRTQGTCQGIIDGEGRSGRVESVIPVISNKHVDGVLLSQEPARRYSASPLRR
jgi:hypothetical protein